MKTIIPVFSIAMAVGTSIIWIKEIFSPGIKQNLLQRREGDHLIWPHIRGGCYRCAVVGKRNRVTVAHRMGSAY